MGDETSKTQSVWKNKLFRMGFMEGFLDNVATKANVSGEEKKDEEGNAVEEDEEENVVEEDEEDNGIIPTSPVVEEKNPPDNIPPNLDRGLSSSNTGDANYKDVNLPSLGVETDTSKQTLQSETPWHPPINPFYNSQPNGMNNKQNRPSNVFYSPKNDSDFIQSTIARIADIITPPPPIPMPKPVRPIPVPSKSTERFQGTMNTDNDNTDADAYEDGDHVESFVATNDGQSTTLTNSVDILEKQKRFIYAWKEWVGNRKKFSKLKTAFTSTINTILETFYLPELIAVNMVNSAYNLKGKNVYYSRDDFITQKKADKRFDEYNRDVITVKKEIRMFVLTACSFFAAFNWWYLIFYTDHYVDINSFLTSESFAPVNWILGPAMGGVAALNYFILGKRLEQMHYLLIINGIVNHKWLSFTLFMVLFMLLYQLFAKVNSNSFDNIMKGEPNEFFKTIIAFGFIYYLFGLPAKSMLSPFWSSILRLTIGLGFIFSIIYVVILFILTMLLLKLAIIFVIFFFMFYSYWSILLFGGNPISAIRRIIADSTEYCSSANPPKDTLSKWILWVKSNLTYIFFASTYFSLVVILLADIDKNISNKTLKTTCNMICTVLLILQIFAVFWMNSHPSNVANVGDVIDATQSELQDKYKERQFSKYLGIVGRILSIILISPLTIIDYIGSIDLLIFGNSSRIFTRWPIIKIIEYLSGNKSNGTTTPEP